LRCRLALRHQLCVRHLHLRPRHLSSRTTQAHPRQRKTRIETSKIKRTCIALKRFGVTHPNQQAVPPGRGERVGRSCLHSVLHPHTRGKHGGGLAHFPET
jgi:hypothetical protein